MVHVTESRDFALSQLKLNGSESLIKVSETVQQRINLSFLERIDEVSERDVTA